MRRQSTRSEARRRSPSARQPAASEVRRLFTVSVVNDLRAKTGYNPRQRRATALRLLVVTVEAFLFGETLGFARLRAFFVKRFGAIRQRAFQLRFKSAQAASFFKAAFEHLVASVGASLDLHLSGPLAAFDDLRVYDATGQRVPARGCAELPACVHGRAGAKCLVGYSLLSGLVEEVLQDAETASDLPMWRRMCAELRPRVLYLMDLAFFERDLFARAKAAGAHLVMRLKSGTKLKVLGHVHNQHFVALPGWSLTAYLQDASRKRGTLYDLDVRWGRGRDAVDLRLVGFAHGGRTGLRWYLSTVPRATLSAQHIVQVYRLRWLIEFLFRDIKQNADIGRSATADKHALQALTYGAMIAHVVVRSLRVAAALRHDVSLDQLRPLGALHALRPFASDLAAVLIAGDPATWHRLFARIANTMVTISLELKPSHSRPRIARELGAIGG